MCPEIENIQPIVISALGLSRNTKKSKLKLPA